MSLLKEKGTFTKRHNKKFTATYFKIEDFAEDEKILYSFLCFTNKIDISTITLENYKTLVEIYVKEQLPMDYDKYRFIPSSSSITNVSTSNTQATLKMLETELGLTLDFILSQEEEKSDDDYKLLIRQFVESVISNGLQEMLQTQLTALYTKAKTSVNILEDTRKKASIMQKRYDINYLIREYQKIIGSPDGELPFSLVGTWGLPEVDSQLFGIRTNLVSTITAGPGVGKSRTLMSIYAYRSAVYHQKNVWIDSLENSTTFMQVLLVCHHIVHVYKGAYNIPPNAVMKKELSPEALSLYESAKRDLFESGKYGKIYLSDTKVYLEDYRAHLSDLIRNHNIELYGLDYIGRLQVMPEGNSRSLDDYKIIVAGYEILQDLTKEFNFHAVIVNQLTKEGENLASTGKEILSGMMQGGIGIDRYIDLGLVLTQTKEQERAGVVTLSSCKNRYEGKTTPVTLKFNKILGLFTSYNRS